MAKNLYAFEKGQPKRLEIDDGIRGGSVSVKLDGAEIYSIPDLKTYQKGVQIPLPDGSQLFVKLQSGMFASNLLVTRDGKPLPGSGGDPKTKLATAYGIIYFVAIVSGIAGLLGVILPHSFMADMGFGWASIISGVLFAVLGYFTQRKSKAALIIAIILLIADGILSLVSMMMSGSNAAGGLIVRVFLILAMIPAVKAIDEIKAEEKGFLAPPPIK
jgi:hypothetical protein